MTAAAQCGPQRAPGARPARVSRILGCLAGALVFVALAVLAYELAVARVPQHRAALERLVREQTGLDVRFEELGLRWGWYGPEAVFRRVELGQPGRSTVLLRAPELVAGFDLWQTLRSGQLQAGRITLVAADIDLSGSPQSLSHPRSVLAAHAARAADGVRMLEGWRSGRVDLEGGTLRLPDPGGSAGPLAVQIRHASVRRASAEWNADALVLLPERLGRTARILVSVAGDLEQPGQLQGTLRFEGRRLRLAGWRELLARAPQAQAFLPRSGGGDIAVDLAFAHGRVVKANGHLTLGGLAWSEDELRAPGWGPDRLRAQWHLTQHGPGWRRLQVPSLELGDATRYWAATQVDLEVGDAGTSVRGRLDRAPLSAVVGWLASRAPQLRLSAADLSGTVSNVTFDWDGAREAGERLRTSADLTEAALALPDRGFEVRGVSGRLWGSERDLTAQLQIEAGRLDLAHTGIDAVRGAARLRLTREQHDGWRIAAEKIELERKGARFTAHGSVSAADATSAAWFDAHAELTGADRSLLERLGGSELLQVLASSQNRLSAGSIARAEADWHGPLEALGDWGDARLRLVLEGARLQAVAGLPAVEDVSGAVVFDAGHLRRSTLTGSWLGGPVVLKLNERREHGAPLISIQGRGLLDARNLALVAVAGMRIDPALTPTGQAPWSAELTLTPANDTDPARWRVQADSTLVGIASGLPEPLAKVPSAALPLHVEAQGTEAAAELHLSLGERVRSWLALARSEAASWQLERGSVQLGGAAAQLGGAAAQLGAAAAQLPATRQLLVQGRVSRLDLPAYVAAWQLLRGEPGMPAIRAELSAAELLVAGRSYPEVRVFAGRTAAGADLRLQSAAIAGTAHWPVATDSGHPALIHLRRLEVPGGTAFDASAALLAALGPATQLSVDDMVWAGRSIGSAAATVSASGDVLEISDLRVAGATEEINGAARCASLTCRLRLRLDSTDAAATLEDFGFRADLSAARASLDADLEWRAGTGRPPLAALAGRLSMRLADGMTRAVPDAEARGPAFPLLLVPALLKGLGQAPSATWPEPEPRGLRFARLEADFELGAGEARTSNLHFDGDAEILIQGRTGLVARSYDQHAWILRGEDRLPGPVRRLGATPGVAAAWLSLRDLFAGGAREAAARAPLHLQGSWDAPIVVAN